MQTYLTSRARALAARPAVLSALLFVPVLLGGCATERLMPTVFMPTPPKECEQVLGLTVEPLPKGKTTDAQLAVWMAKEGAARQKEHEMSKVCAEYALRTAGVMKDKDKPATKGGVEAASPGVVDGSDPTLKWSKRPPRASTAAAAEFPGSGS